MAGIELEGVDPPEPNDEERQAVQAWNLMADRNGHIDWSALPIARALYGITDEAGLVERLLVIKLHRTPDRPGE